MVDQIGDFLRIWLDRLYLFCGYIAAASLVTILLLVTLQMIVRWTGEIFLAAPIMPVILWLHQHFLPSLMD